jgi:hypothetical protein
MEIFKTINAKCESNALKNINKLIQIKAKKFSLIYLSI